MGTPQAHGADPNVKLVAVVDGGDATQGAMADAAAGDEAGSVNAHLRQIAKMTNNPPFSVSDSITRPANATAYAARSAPSSTPISS